MFGKKKKEVSVLPEIKSKQINLLIFLAYLALGIYFINKQFKILNIPEQIIKFDNWIILLGGFFLILGAIYYLKSKK
jgi:predicted membrane channel-forming protein YqfA (hemolysin III family)